MLNFLIYIIFFNLILISIVGYGFLANRLFFKTENYSLLGFIGLSFLTFLGLTTSLFTNHDYLHNTVIFFIGLILAFIFSYKDKLKIKYLKYSIFLSLILFITSISATTHSDFDYYHLPYTLFLTEHKITFGIGHANHSYNFVSSLFYLNSLFVLPFISYNSINIVSICFLIFFNYFLLVNIFKNQENNYFIKFFSFLSFLFFNIIFWKIEQFGTDYQGQLLLIVIFIFIIQTNLNSNNINLYENYKVILFLMLFCITIKSIFITYILFGLILLFNLVKNKKLNIFFSIISSKFFFFSLLLLIINFTHHFASSGCLISPIKATCFPNFAFWSVDHVTSGNLSNYVEFWAKGGVGLFKTLSYTLIEEYNSNFIWLKNYKNTHLFGKLFFSMKVGILCLAISFFLYYKIELKKIRFFDISSEYLVNILVLIFIFYVWFDYHPRLRYGGYLICFILGSTIIIPLIHNFFKLKDKNLNLLKVFCILVFIGKIIFSINYSYKYKGNFENFPFYKVSKPTFKVKNYNDNFSINYSISTHCGVTPSLCAQRSDEWIGNIEVYNYYGYNFISRNY